MKIVKIIAKILAVIIVLIAAVTGTIHFISGAGLGSKNCIQHGVPYQAVIAHRGVSYLAPEETSPAYILARELGADYLEADIQRTRDGVLIAVHDDTLERTTDVAEIFPMKKTDTVNTFLFSEIRKLDAGSWFNKKYPERGRKSYAGLKILSLEEIIAIAEGGINKPGLYLEVKDPQSFPGIEEELVRLLKKKGWIKDTHEMKKFSTGTGVTVGLTSARVILQSFDARCVDKFAKLAPGVPRVNLYNSDDVMERGWDSILKTAIDNDSGLGPSGYEAYPFKNGRAHRAGRFIHTYTINKTWQMRLLSLFGSDGFFTDRTDVLLKYYGRVIPQDPLKILEKNGY